MVDSGDLTYVKARRQMVRQKVRDEELISQYIVLPEDDLGTERARLQPAGVSVWVLMQRLQQGEALDELAREYDVPVDAVYAAIAYYERHRAVIDAQIALVDAAFAD